MTENDIDGKAKDQFQQSSPKPEKGEPILILVTGVPGSGKSAVYKELVLKGYTAYDSDSGISRRVDKKWEMDPKRIKDLAAPAPAHAYKDNLVFVCGVAQNEAEVRGLFHKVIALTINDEVMNKRLTERPNNDFAKDPKGPDRKNMLGMNRAATAAYQELGYSVIDSTQPLAQVVNEVLSAVKGKFPEKKPAVTPPSPPPSPA